MPESRDLSFSCPMGDGTVTAKTEAELIKKVRDHSKRAHKQDMTEQQAKDMIAGKMKM